MRTGTLLVTGLLSVGLLAAGPAGAQSASAKLSNSEGAAIGSVTMTQLAKGVQIIIEASDLPAGEHAFHIHAVGACEPPEFKSAGGHFNPTGAEHGWDNPGGHHAGDLPNIHVGDDGTLSVEYLTDAVTLGPGPNSLFDADGSAVVMHQDADDYQSDPAGNAGPRIACGVLAKSE